MTIRLKRLMDFWIGNLLLGLLLPAVRLVAYLMKRNHSLENVQSIALIKMLGGGSLFMTLPSLYSIQKKHPHLKINLICSPAVAPFARTMQVFDTILIIQDSNLLSLAKSSLQTLLYCWKECDTIIDLEIHSRLSTIFSTITCAKNRIGLIDGHSLWRKRLYTHSIYTNSFNGIYNSYDSLATLLGVTHIEVSAAQKQFRQQVKSFETSKAALIPKHSIAVGVGCSDLAIERTLPAEIWVELLNQTDTPIIFLGGKTDKNHVEEILNKNPQLRTRTHDYCGRLTLEESLYVLSQCQAFYGIDSALIHYARFLGLQTVSFWGPTSPLGLLRPLQIDESINYKNLPCSPCVHVTTHPPCGGNNICMKHNPQQLASLKIESSNGPKKMYNTVWMYGPDGQPGQEIRVHAEV